VRGGDAGFKAEQEIKVFHDIIIDKDGADKIFLTRLWLVIGSRDEKK
jgi:hypothetical protein